MAEFEPQIVAFICNWCTYAAADLAGTSRLHYPHNVRIVRMMCSGMVDPVYILRAFEGGADGVLVAGCKLGECHYIRGNYSTRYSVDILKNILGQIGFNEDRVWLRWISASEGQLFAQTIAEMTEHLRRIGPSPLKGMWAV